MNRYLLQCVAVCCSVLQYVAVCSSVQQSAAVCCSALQCAAVCCSVLQCVAVRCSVLQCTFRHCSTVYPPLHLLYTSVAVCCSVLQCVAVCCSTVYPPLYNKYSVNCRDISLSHTFFFPATIPPSPRNQALCYIYYIHVARTLETSDPANNIFFFSSHYPAKP